jgi:hypothetical protein
LHLAGDLNLAEPVEVGGAPAADGIRSDKI